MFDERGYEQLADQGVLDTVVPYDRHREPREANPKLPLTTRSQIIEFRDTEGRKIARAHQHMLPSGERGASGLLDPKAIYDYGLSVAYRVP